MHNIDANSREAHSRDAYSIDVPSMVYPENIHWTCYRHAMSSTLAPDLLII